MGNLIKEEINISYYVQGIHWILTLAFYLAIISSCKSTYVLNKYSTRIAIIILHIRGCVGVIQKEDILNDANNDIEHETTMTLVGAAFLLIN